MKNVFKFLGIAFVACSMFVACGDDVETFTIKVKANDSSLGTVTGGGKYESGATATLEATANAGYEFVNWDNGSTNTPLIVTVTADAEYTANFQAANGINVAAENLQAAESRIRDTDMASEMVEYTKNQILTQSGTAMLAQANSQSQNVLALLR